MPWFLGNGSSISPFFRYPFFGGPVVILIIWSLVIKGFALWHAARRNDPWWFVGFLVINTAGLLEAFYLLVIVKVFTSSQTTSSQTQIASKVASKRRKK